MVYKPRDLRIEAAFQDILDVTFAGVRDPPRAITVAPRGPAYGYCEFVEHMPARTAAELRAHYTNAGRLLALLYALGANDCHHETSSPVGTNSSSSTARSCWKAGCGPGTANGLRGL